MPITLPDATRRELVASIQTFFREERGDEVGELQAGFFLDFVVQEIGPSVYNQAVRDVQARLQAGLADLDAAMHQEELGWTAGRGGVRRGRR